MIFSINYSHWVLKFDKAADAIEEDDEKKPVPDFMKSILLDKIIELDVRPIMKRARFLYYVSSVALL